MRNVELGMRRVITILIVVLLSTIVAQGQIRIGGNVYGGGNHAEVKGSTKVTVKAGDIGAVLDPNAERPLEDPQGKVFGGARMANVGGNTFVHIDGKSDLTGDLATKSNYILINQVFGGNDIAGQIGTAAAVGEEMPTELTAVKAADDTDPKKNVVDETFNSYVRVSTKATNEYYTAEEIAAAASDPENAAYGKTTDDVKPDPNARKIYIGQLFAGGNGDFDYVQTPGPDENQVTHTIYNRSDKDHMIPLAEMVTDASEVGFQLPELDKTYLEVVGGSIVYAYGGGNNATVKEKTIIHIDNPSAVVNHIYVDKDTWAEDPTATAESNTIKDLLCTARFKEMGINTGFSKPSSGAYQVGRFFGGNNKAEMHIRPTWNLLAGKVRNLYSGGNQGNMTCPEGLLLEIPTYSTLIVDNLYGGCRMADVMPTVNGVYVPCTNLKDKDKDGNLLYKFPDELSARVLVRGGYIHNIYGGNDVTGTVYGGNALGIYTTVHGDVYGGGNGSYPYTDNDHTYKDDDVYGDFLYSTDGYSSSIEALNAFRPNAEQVSIRLKGTDADHPTIIKGSVFVGGNCASLDTKKDDPMVELKIGSHVWVDKVFLGNNGEGMIDEGTLQHYAGVYPGAAGFSSINYMKTDASAFANYMDGVTMNLQPSIVFDSKANGDPDDYIDYTSKIGSFYCGGNVGSMAIAGKNTYKVDRGLVIFEKFVAGCNNADVPEGDYNAAYEGGILGAQNERGGASDEYYTDNGTATGKIKDRIELNLDNVVIEPHRWNDTFEPITAADIEEGKLKAGQEYYTTNLRLSRFIADGTEPASTTATDKYYKLTVKGNQLDWNTAMWSTDEDDFMSTGTGGTGTGTDGTGTANDEKRRLLGGNVYGGCYNSGHVNGNVVININQDLTKRDVVFAEADSDDPYQVKDGGERRSGVLREAQGDDVQAVAMTVFGAGYGEETEIWGSTTVNLNNGYTFQIFGGGEEGVVGKKNTSGEYVYNAAYSSTVNMKGANAGYSEKESGLPLAETEYIYGGGSEGDVLGDTYVYLGNGRVYDAFGGASNADIYGGTEVYIGHNGGFPWIRDNVYGGNDFGGNIKGKRNHTTAITKDAFDASMLQSSTYVKYVQGRVDSIFGGCYGSYPYADPIFKDYTYSTGEANIPTGKSAGSPRLDENNEPVFSFPHMEYNSFVHFTPEENGNNKVGFIFGGSDGFPGHVELNNTMQKECYVHVHDSKTKDANRFANVDIYGGGAFAGTGILGDSPENTYYGAGRTAIDLYGGSFHNVYGGCNQEGLVGYTRVNVPSGSTVKVNALFGGGKGYSTDLIAETPALAARYCDHYVTCIDYQSEDAIVNDAIYGGNENCRISADTYINIGAPVMQSSGYQATIYGAGYGKKTVSGRTNVFMNNNSNAYKVFGGGRDGNAFNYVSLQQWLTNQLTAAGTAEGDMSSKLSEYNHLLLNFGTYLAANPITLPDKTGTYANNMGEYDGTYINDLIPTTEKPTPTFHQTNVHIMNGGNVSGYAYGGGFGTDAVVAGSTYIELKGGNVDRDIYGGGQGGPVFDEFGLGTNVFTATTNVYVEGGMARNVYGGGYLGHVGKHCKTVNNAIVEAAIHDSNENDIPAVANVTIGKVDGTSFYNGIPSITRNVYGGGEGGSVYGTANLTINNGYIGYRYKNTAASGAPVYEYVEELDDQKPNDIELAGNAFGGGYVVNSYVDKTNVEMYGGTIRGSLYGGGEVGPIGRGTIRYANSAPYNTNGLPNGNARIYKAGKSHVKMYNGLVKRNVFGGGRGKDSWGGDGTMFMDEDLKPTLDLQCKGFVFGQTEVDIFGGEVGTDEGMAQGYGNVFGGGDEGSVYSALEINGTLHIGNKNGERYKDDTQGYYFLYNGTSYIVKDNGEYTFTEDCKVLIEPWLQVKNTSISYDPDGDGPENSKTYKVGDYIPTSYLNTLKAKVGENWPSEWANLDVGTATDNGFKERGVIIHNAVFAGGNIASGSSTMYANEKTVFGNATASVHDVYNRDFITIGTGHTGGLYGDGNLTFVDGYRELNITNYGSDYYHIARSLSYQDYLQLPKREQDYYEVKYTCIATQGCTDRDGTTYKKDASLPKDELIALFTKDDGTSVMNNADGSLVTEGSGGTAVLTGVTIGQLEPNPVIWRQDGVVSTYAGRIMNTIQRADLCGVFGSRMVMKGARDRVPETVDYTNYTINRVREVSLNKKDSPAGDTDDDNKMHGNYFGIYSIVNYLGSLTSDVDFQSVRTTKAGGDLAADNTTTFEQWKEAHKTDRKRNNGNCHNQMALASGVYLELTSEEKTGKTVDTKEWGLITGVVELDLINVQAGIGGGFVYAKNEHGYRTLSGRKTTTLTKLNEGAVTQWDFNYDTTDEAWTTGTTGKKEWETSGNFIHSSQTIIDDCYNVSNRYLGEGAVKAHYWFISGQVYVYDQYISAYTGSPNAFSETVEIPITINAASNGTMTLVDVKPNLYAFYSSYTNSSTFSKLGGDKKLVINDVTYQLNDPISYWDWNKLPQSEKNLFVEKTYILKDSCYINSQYYPAGYVMSSSEYTELKGHAVDHEVDGKTVKAVKKATKNAAGDPVVEKDKDNQDVYVAFTDAFRLSNNISHNKGYILTYNVNNPTVWDKWYTQIQDDPNDVLVKNQTGGNGFEDGPTYYPTESGLYGQQRYAKNDIIPQKTYTDYTSALTQLSQSPTGQATFTGAHLVTSECTSGGIHYYPGAAVSAAISGYTSPAYVCTSTIKLSDAEYIYINELMTESQKTTYYNRFNKEGATDAEKLLAADIDKFIVPAYICTGAGLYGGNYYLSNKNYRALEAWSSMSETDRQSFEFNYDALDLLVDSTYSRTKSMKYQYDGKGFKTAEEAATNPATYSLKTPIDYKATYNGANDTQEHNGITRTNGVEYTRVQYESLPNEQRHYAPILVTAAGTIYVVKTDFVHVETPYAAGTIISSEEFGRLTGDEKTNVTALTFTASDFSGTGTTYYYCREEYKIGEKGEGVTPAVVTGITGASGGIVERTDGNWVTAGTIINAESNGDNKGYADLPNYQKNFTIHGVSPTETSTLYVGRNADINDLSTEKIITVIYKYDYEESDADGMHITPVSERHVVNIHIKFKSGVPVVEDIQEPSIVLPGTSLTMRVPNVTEGAYDVLGGGWELFDTPANAESHTNGVDYKMLNDSLYWYQDGYYLAYYAKTYLGKTYSNHVPVHVANYHDLKKVMDDKKHHLHVDYDRSLLKRDSKIYINDYSSHSQNGLDLFKNFYDLSLLTNPSTDSKTGLINSGSFIGHKPLNTNETNGVKAGHNLQFILRTDLTHEDNPAVANEWTSIASGENDPCFNGTLHGDGHTISGLDNSLFGKLCGSVYNLGVTGSFTSAGVADSGDGYVESCWINTTGTPNGNAYAVFGDPTDSETHTKQIVNSYYQATKNYKTDANSHGLATPMTDQAFYNGEVAYNLNNFYLYKRYSDKQVSAGVGYKYWKPGETTPQTGHYANHADFCSSGYGTIKYVEERFADGDFRYAGGTIPTETDERLYTDTEDNNKEKFFPIWPDDYIFFGQRLTYGWAVEAHQDVPTAIVKSNGRLSQLADANRVYRAPAYYGSSTMGVAHFNPQVYLAQKEKNGSRDAYPGMTAIDFAGHNDTHNEANGANMPYELGLNAAGKFYAPLLDDGGLIGITNYDETQNLLVYAPAETAASEGSYANKATYDVLTSYFQEPQYSDYYSADNYRTVADASSVTSSIYGHLVLDGKIAKSDHLLVDKQDFNCPIAYKFDNSHRMWYQRKPEDQEFVDHTKGWQGISIPFTAELVTTNEKGEITHFYEGSATSANSDSKIGHEYWLRELNDLTEETVTINNTPTLVAKGSFLYPKNSTGSKNYTNTFLWDYYYKNTELHDQKDRNSDIYQTYYNSSHNYSGYPLLAAATPYIIGFPGQTYYEFDLSGNFKADNTSVSIPELGKQLVTFASNTGITIEVSDDENKDVTKTLEGTNKNFTFTFHRNYRTQNLGTSAYTLNPDGSRYDKVTDEGGSAVSGGATSIPFRPYFTASSVAKSAGARQMMPEYIYFGGDFNGLEEETTTILNGGLEIYAKNHKIITTSHLKSPVTITIVNVSGITYANYVLQPGETQETRVQNSGVYIVNRKKLLVR
jgi:hypothetical protein